jgi:ribonuclease Z
MSLDVIPLGTGSAIPAHGRHLSAFAVVHAGRVVLFDCGEATQYRLADAGVRQSRIEAICITHLHGDHFYGLMGLVSTMALLGRGTPLTVVGPAGLVATMEAVPGVATRWLPFEIRYVEVPEGFEHAVVYESAIGRIEARPLSHRIFAMGFRLTTPTRRGRVDAATPDQMGVTGPDIGRLLRGEVVRTTGGHQVRPETVLGPERPGMAVAYCLDTMPCDGARILAEGADLLIHEATFTEEHRQRAADTAHSTARQAAETARAAGARRLLLTHFSSRYVDPDPLVAEAREVFPNTAAAEELSTVRLTPAEIA